MCRGAISSGCLARGAFVCLTSGARPQSAWGPNAFRKRCYKIEASKSEESYLGYVQVHQPISQRGHIGKLQTSGFKSSVAMGASRADVTYLNQVQAQKVDEELMGPLGFSIDQLMELAGLSVASAIASECKAASSVLVLAGPGNNGGDGLVAARHLHHFGYDVHICYPKSVKKPLYEGLVTQCKSLKLKFVSAEDCEAAEKLKKYDIILDALFGFSFQPPVRQPFDRILDAVVNVASSSFIASVDIPSGWHVEEGDSASTGLAPDMLISLTSPKAAAKFFKGKYHYLGGRFVPPEIKEKYGLRLPSYPGISQCVRLYGSDDVHTAVSEMRGDERKMTEELVPADLPSDPMEQFERSFKEAAQRSGLEEPNAVTLATASKDGRPSARVVLLKGFDASGFVFYTSKESHKADDLKSNPRAALCFYWEGMGESVRVYGDVEDVSEEEAEEYFHSRPRSSQLGAWCSHQSSGIATRKVLNGKLAELEAQYKGKEIPKPPYWGGYRVKPTEMEFWLARPNRLHDRIQYRLGNAGKWFLERLSP